MTRDLDCTMMEYVQFTFQYGCPPSNTPHGNGPSSASRSNAVLLQYSNNGGISWTLLEELYDVTIVPPKFISIDLPMGAKMNATRFRFWQPAGNAGELILKKKNTYCKNCDQSKQDNDIVENESNSGLTFNNS